jgi:hypothetical protein
MVQQAFINIGGQEMSVSEAEAMGLGPYIEMNNVYYVDVPDEETLSPDSGTPENQEVQATETITAEAPTQETSDIQDDESDENLDIEGNVQSLPITPTEINNALIPTQPEVVTSPVETFNSAIVPQNPISLEDSLQTSVGEPEQIGANPIVSEPDDSAQIGANPIINSDEPDFIGANPIVNEPPVTLPVTSASPPSLENIMSLLNTELSREIDWASLGYPEFSDKYAPLEVPTGYTIASATENPDTGLNVQFTPTQQMQSFMDDVQSKFLGGEDITSAIKESSELTGFRPTPQMAENLFQTYTQSNALTMQSNNLASTNFWQAIGYPQYAGKYSPIDIPKGMQISSLTEVLDNPDTPIIESGLNVALKPTAQTQYWVDMVGKKFLSGNDTASSIASITSLFGGWSPDSSIVNNLVYSLSTPSALASQQSNVASRDFFNSIGYPQFAGRYNPFAIPEGDYIKSLTEIQDNPNTPEVESGLSVVFGNAQLETLQANLDAKNANDQLTSESFFNAIGYPQYAGKYAPIEIPTGFQIDTLTEISDDPLTPEIESGINATFKPNTETNTFLSRFESLYSQGLDLNTAINSATSQMNSPLVTYVEDPNYINVNGQKMTKEDALNYLTGYGYTDPSQVDLSQFPVWEEPIAPTSSTAGYFSLSPIVLNNLLEQLGTPEAIATQQTYAQQKAEADSALALSTNFYNAIGYSQYAGKYAPIAIPTDRFGSPEYTIAGLTETPTGLQATFTPTAKLQQWYSLVSDKMQGGMNSGDAIRSATLAMNNWAPDYVTMEGIWEQGGSPAPATKSDIANMLLQTGGQQALTAWTNMGSPLDVEPLDIATASNTAFWTAQGLPELSSYKAIDLPTGYKIADYSYQPVTGPFTDESLRPSTLQLELAQITSQPTGTITPPQVTSSSSPLDALGAFISNPLGAITTMLKIGSDVTALGSQSDDKFTSLASQFLNVEVGAGKGIMNEFIIPTVNTIQNLPQIISSGNSIYGISAQNVLGSELNATPIYTHDDIPLLTPSTQLEQYGMLGEQIGSAIAMIAVPYALPITGAVGATRTSLALGQIIGGGLSLGSTVVLNELTPEHQELTPIDLLQTTLSGAAVGGAISLAGAGVMKGINTLGTTGKAIVSSVAGRAGVNAGIGAVIGGITSGGDPLQIALGAGTGVLMSLGTDALLAGISSGKISLIKYGSVEIPLEASPTKFSNNMYGELDTSLGTLDNQIARFGIDDTFTSALDDQFKSVFGNNKTSPLGIDMIVGGKPTTLGEVIGVPEPQTATWKGLYISKGPSARILTGEVQLPETFEPTPIIGTRGSQVEIPKINAVQSIDDALIELGAQPIPDLLIQSHGSTTKGGVRVVGEAEGWKPTSNIERQVTLETMSGLGYSDETLTATNNMLRLMGITQNVKSQFIEDLLPQETETLGTKGVQVVKDYVIDQKAVVEKLYGSFTAKSQLNTLDYEYVIPRGGAGTDTDFVSSLRTPGDIDVQTNLNEEQVAEFTKNLVAKLRAVGEDVSVSPEKPSLIVKNLGNGETAHAVDIHSIGDGTADVAEMAWGFKLSKPTIKIEEIDVQTLTEQGVRKGANSILGFTDEGTLSPVGHRMKDVADFFQVQRTLIDSMEMGRIPNLAKVTEASNLLEDLSAYYGVTDLKTLPVTQSYTVSGSAEFIPSSSSTYTNFGTSVGTVYTSKPSKPSNKSSSTTIQQQLEQIINPSESTVIVDDYGNIIQSLSPSQTTALSKLLYTISSGLDVSKAISQSPALQGISSTSLSKLILESGTQSQSLSAILGSKNIYLPSSVPVTKLGSITSFSAPIKIEDITSQSIPSESVSSKQSSSSSFPLSSLLSSKSNTIDITSPSTIISNKQSKPSKQIQSQSSPESDIIQTIYSPSVPSKEVSSPPSASTILSSISEIVSPQIQSKTSQSNSVDLLIQSISLPSTTKPNKYQQSNSIELSLNDILQSSPNISTKKSSSTVSQILNTISPKTSPQTSPLSSQSPNINPISVILKSLETSIKSPTITSPKSPSVSVHSPSMPSPSSPKIPSPSVSSPLIQSDSSPSAKTFTSKPPISFTTPQGGTRSFSHGYTGKWYAKNNPVNSANQLIYNQLGFGANFEKRMTKFSPKAKTNITTMKQLTKRTIGVGGNLEKLNKTLTTKTKTKSKLKSKR